MKRVRVENGYTDFAVMAWLELRKFSNAYSRIKREPLRLIGWLCWLLFFIWKLVLQPRGIGRLPADVAAVPMDVAASILLAVASIALIRGEQPAKSFFASPLEAYWMNGSRLRAWITVPYLQLRNVVQRPPSLMFFIVFVLSFCMPTMHSALQTFLAVLNVTLVTFCSRIFALPRELAPRGLRIILIAAGVAMGAFALVAGSEAASDMLLNHRLFPAWIPVLHPGLAFVYGARGDVAVTLAGGGLLIALLGALVMLSHDRYPELYEISRAGWELRSRLREGRLYESGAEAAGDLDAAGLARIPAGAQVLLWTNWQMYRRQSFRHWPKIRPVLVFAGGVGIASLHIGTEKLETTLGVIFGLVTSYSSLLDATRIGTAIRHPIFWLTNVSYTARLTMVVFSWYWRSAIDLVFFGTGALCAGAPHGVIALVVACAIVGVWLQRCVGLAGFAILPSKVDINGPMAFVIFTLTVAMAIPPAVTGFVSAILLHSIAIGCGFGGFVALVESILLIFAAGRLLDGRFDKILGG